MKTPLVRIAAAAIMFALPAIASAQLGPDAIAFGKLAYHSSDYSVDHQAAKAVDGNTDGIYSNNFSTHTQSDDKAWWYVDLGDTYLISSIKVWNRTDCCTDRLSNFYVSILSAGTSNPELFSSPTAWQSFNSGSLAGASEVFTPGTDVFGRYVKVQLRDANYLHLAEVDVQGSLGSGTIVPEPSSFALLGSGLILMVVRSRRRKDASQV